MATTDERVQKMSEVVTYIKFIKMYAWVKAFSQIVQSEFFFFFIVVWEGQHPSGAGRCMGSAPGMCKICTLLFELHPQPTLCPNTMIFIISLGP